MRIEVYDEKPKETEKVLRLRLADMGGFVELQAVDEKGHRLDQGGLIQFGADGVGRNYCVDPGLGLPLDSHGRLIVE